METKTFVMFTNVVGSTITLKISDVIYLEEHHERFVIHVTGPGIINVNKQAFEIVRESLHQMEQAEAVL